LKILHFASIVFTICTYNLPHNKQRLRSCIAVSG